MAARIILVIGSPGSGKTWVCNQLNKQFKYLAHDDFDTEARYIGELIATARESEIQVLGEAPFGISKMMDVCSMAGIPVHPVFIIEDEDVIATRYLAREGHEIPKGHLTRQRTYRDRAEQLGAFQGTSEEVLNYLKGGM